MSGKTTGPSKHVRTKRDQSGHAEVSQMPPEDDPAVDEFCHLVAIILARILI